MPNNNSPRSLKVFLCHASSDKEEVRKLYSRLVNDGVDAWLDKEKLIPGQNWQVEIPKEVRNSDIVIVCISSQSVNKEGYVQKEIKIALDAADEKPEGTIFIIPARLEDCNIPDRINQFHWVDLFAENGYEWLLKALHMRANSIGAAINPSSSTYSLSITQKKENSNIRLWWTWLGATMLGTVIGIIMFQSFNNIGVVDDNYLGIGFGIILGFTQWLVIRKYISFSIWWIPLCVIVTLILGNMGVDLYWWVIIILLFTASFFFLMRIKQKKESK